MQSSDAQPQAETPAQPTYEAADLLRLPQLKVHKLTYPRRLAGLDIETLDVVDNSAVIEIAMVSCVIAALPDEKDTVKLLRSANTEMVFTFNVIDQIARGRSMDGTTYAFHLQKLGHTGLMELLGAGLNLDETATQQSLTQIQRYLNGMQEIWINGLSFDPGIVTSLARSYGYVSGNKTGALWDFQKERDTRTVYRTFPLQADKTPAIHRALPDATWCLEEAWVYHVGCSRFGNFLVNQYNEEQKLKAAAATAEANAAAIAEGTGVESPSLTETPKEGSSEQPMVDVVVVEPTAEVVDASPVESEYKE